MKIWPFGKPFKGSLQKALEPHACRNVPGIELRVESPHGPVLQVTSEMAHFIARYAGYPGIRGAEWYPILDFLEGWRILIKPIIISPPNDDHEP